MALVISKALPIEFWVNGELTYNNTTYPNIQKFLYNQQFLCSDNIKLKVFEDIEGNAKEYRVDIYDEAGVTILATIPFTRTTETFPTINTSVISQFGSGIPTTNIPWNTVTQEVVGNLNPPACASKFLNVAQIIGGRADLPLSFSVPYTLSTIGDNSVTLTHFLYNSDLSMSVQIDGPSRSANGSYTDSYTLTPSFVPVYVVTRASFLGTTTAAKVKINVPISLTSFYSSSSDYELNFVANDYDLCSKCLVFKIVQVEADTLLYSDDMTNFPATGWTQNSLTALFATSDWANAGAAQGTMGYHSPTTSNMKVLHHSQTIESGKKYKVNIRFLIEDNAISSNVYKLVLYNIGSGAILEQFEMSSVNGPTSGFDRTDSYIFTAGFDGDEIGVSTQLQASVDNDNNISINSFDIYEHVDEELIASSEAVEFSNDIEVNVQMFYKSTEDFAGIKYTDLSDYFMIRFAGTFFHPNSILETSVIETTETIITNATSLKKERKLQVGDIPEYMQDKLALVLMHSAKGSLKIHNVEWAASSAIEDDGERPGSYPMKAKTTMLTRKRFLYRNAI